MSKIKFLNVDLNLRVSTGIKELLKAFGPGVFELQSEEEKSLSVELSRQPKSIDEAILAFYNIVDNLPPKMRAIWDSCEMRSMNIGIQAGTGPYSESFRLSEQTISRLSLINAEVIVTIYAAR